MTNEQAAAEPLRIGILGAARIAPRALIEPVAALDGVEVTAVAARDRSRAEAFAAEHGIDGVLDSYDELIASDDIDIVYNPLPMSHHASWTIAALEAGRHVLCEKPLAANADEARAMVEAADRTGRRLGEAFHYRYHPLFAHVLDEVSSGRIGRVEHVDARFDVEIVKTDFRWDYAFAGGALMDLGCYPVSWVRHVAAAAAPGGSLAEVPEVSSAEAVEGPPRIDATMTADLRFASGVTAAVTSSMERPLAARLVIEGTDGRIEVDNPLSPQVGNRLTVRSAGGVTAGPFEAGNTYHHMVRAFVDHVVHDRPFVTAGDESVANMALIDAIYTAAGLPPRGTEG